MPMLELRNVHLAYGRQEALHDVTLSVRESSIVSLVGANGAGKTSTLRAIIGLNATSGGDILFQGERIDGQDAPSIVARGIALSPEGRRLFPQMSVYENLLCGAYLRRGGPEVERTIERIYQYFPKLAERRSQHAGSLSGGEQQMVAIGRALMAQPKLLLLDEPSLGLAPLMVREIARIVSEISSAEGIAVVLVEQNANMALRLCDYAYVLEHGRVALEGQGKELLRSDYVRKAYLGV
jgi:branched-chain amino acid transport system ATP-binding protein